jgi:hypothetical protein
VDFFNCCKRRAQLSFCISVAQGKNILNYRNLSVHGQFELKSFVHQVRIEVGEVACAFSYPLSVALPELDEQIQTITQEYVNTAIQSQQKPSKSISIEAILMSKIASGLEKI